MAAVLRNRRYGVSTLADVGSNPSGRGKFRHGKAGRDMEYGGDGQFSNPPNDPVTLDGVPYRARLRAFDARSGWLVREWWSNADGTWLVQYLNRARTYLVVCYDGAAYPPLAYDQQTPDPMT